MCKSLDIVDQMMFAIVGLEIAVLFQLYFFSLNVQFYFPVYQVQIYQEGINKIYPWSSIFVQLD